MQLLATLLASTLFAFSSGHPVDTSINVSEEEWPSLNLSVYAESKGNDGIFFETPIMKVDSHRWVFSVGGSDGFPVSFILKNGTILYDHQDVGVYVNFETGDCGNVNEWGTQEPTPGFTTSDGNLIFDPTGNNWNACPSGVDQYSLSVYGCTGGIPINLHIFNM